MIMRPLAGGTTATNVREPSAMYDYYIDAAARAVPIHGLS